MQSEVQRPYEEVVWYQTEELGIDAESKELARFQTAFAYLLTQAKDEVGRFPRRPLAAGTQEQMTRLQAAKAAVAKGLSTPPELDDPRLKAIALWPIDEENKAKGDLPKGAGWVGLTTAIHSFRDRSGERRLGYFESAGCRAKDEPPILTIFQRPAPVPSKPNWLAGCILTIAGLLLFILAMGGAMGTGGVIAEAHRIVTMAERDIDQTFSKTIEGLCEKYGDLCDSSEAKTVLATCVSQMAPKELYEIGIILDRVCAQVWAEALRAADSDHSASGIDWLADQTIWILTIADRSGASIASSDMVSLVPYFFISMVGLIFLFIGLGFWTSGRWSGVAINAQNRMSLSLIQVTAWTIVILSAYATYCAFNVGALGAASLVKSLPAGSPEANSLFPQLEAWAWAVMGIVIASPIASALIKGAKPEHSANGLEDQAQPSSTLNLKLGPLSRNLSPSEASIRDIFLGEDKANHTQLDISRAQNVIITALLLFTFAGWLVSLMGGVAMNTALEAFVYATPILSKFPEPGPTFTALLALTHAAYLGGKWKPKT